MLDVSSEMLSTKDCPKTGRVDKLYAGDLVDLDITLTDPNDCPVDFTDLEGLGYEDLDSGVEGQLPSPTPPEYDENGNLKDMPIPGQMPPGWSAWYIAKPTYTLNRDLIIFPLKAKDAAKGRFTTNIYGYFQKKPPNPGIYYSEVVIRDDKCRARFRQQRWLDIRPTLSYNSVGPLTEAEIRMAMRDFGCLNTLLDNKVEFETEEIFYAIIHPVDLWNATPPFIKMMTPTTFPYRGMWLIGAVGYLLSAGALSRLRNQMMVQGDNLVITDKGHGDAYERIGRDYTARYEEWVKMAKVALNINEGFGTLGSMYIRLARGRAFH